MKCIFKVVFLVEFGFEYVFHIIILILKLRFGHSVSMYSLLGICILSW
jgi:hypothetical protein